MEKTLELPNGLSKMVGDSTNQLVKDLQVASLSQDERSGLYKWFKDNGIPTDTFKDELLGYGYLSSQDIEPGDVEVVLDPSKKSMVYNIKLSAKNLKKYHKFKKDISGLEVLFHSPYFPKELETLTSFLSSPASKRILGIKELAKVKKDLQKSKRSLKGNELKEITFLTIKLALVKSSAKLNIEYNISRFVKENVPGYLLSINLVSK